MRNSASWWLAAFLLVASSVVPALAQVRVEAVRPDRVPVTEHTRVEVVGAGFEPGMKISFNDRWAWQTEYAGPTLLRAITPVSLSPGAAVVKIMQGDELFVPLQPPDIFTFEADFTYEKILEGRHFFQTQALGQAEASYGEILAAGVKDADIHSFVLGLLADVLFLQGRLEEAAQLVEKANDLYPRYDTNHALLAQILRRQGKVREARKAISRAGAGGARPGSELVHAQILAVSALWMHEERGDPSGITLRVLERQRQKFPRDSFLRALSGILKCRFDRADEGTVELEQALAEASWDRRAELHAWLGEAYQRRGQPGDKDHAQQAWREATQLNPMMPTQYFNQGLALWNQGRYDYARSLLQQARAMGLPPQLDQRAREVIENREEW